ncbi:MAG: phytanoyl-CoA dioxygenase family protein [Alphaproteobacteria bacterium]|nr:phytanoyl-CoA dioxygenase family protein [Alphaproteobacteria bacterium]
MPRLLSSDQIGAYRRDGFLSPVTVMSEREAAEYRARLEAVEAAWPDAMQGANRNNAHLNLKVLDELTHHPRILDAVEDLLGPDILVCGTVLFIKEPGDPGFVSWHQDAKYMGLEPYADATTIWLALSPATEESGCMRMSPGSHAAGMRDHEDTYLETNILTRGQSVYDVDEAAAVSTPLRPGQMSFHNLAVLHASSPNRSDDRRIGFAVQSYLKPTVRQTRGETFVQLARGTDPNRYLRHIGRPKTDMAAEDVAMREKVNALWSDVLYFGAEKRRNF